MIQADRTMHSGIVDAVSNDLVGQLTKNISNYEAICQNLPKGYKVGDIEDANVLARIMHGGLADVV